MIPETVGQLIEALQKFDPDTRVAVASRVAGRWETYLGLFYVQPDICTDQWDEADEVKVPCVVLEV